MGIPPPTYSFAACGHRSPRSAGRGHSSSSLTHCGCPVGQAWAWQPVTPTVWGQHLHPSTRSRGPCGSDREGTNGTDKGLPI